MGKKKSQVAELVLDFKTDDGLDRIRVFTLGKGRYSIEVTCEDPTGDAQTFVTLDAAQSSVLGNVLAGRSRPDQQVNLDRLRAEADALTEEREDTKVGD